MLKMNSTTLTTWCEELTHWKRPWCWGTLKAGGKGDDRGWDGWMASQARRTWVWASSGGDWRTGKPGVLQFMGLQRVAQDFATEPPQQQIVSVAVEVFCKRDQSPQSVDFKLGRQSQIIWVDPMQSGKRPAEPSWGLHDKEEISFGDNSFSQFPRIFWPALPNCMPYKFQTCIACPHNGTNQSLQQQMAFPGGSDGKESAYNAGDSGLIPGLGRAPGEGHSNPLQYCAWRLSGTEKSGGLQSLGSQRVGHDWVTDTFSLDTDSVWTKILHWDWRIALNLSVYIHRIPKQNILCAMVNCLKMLTICLDYNAEYCGWKY